MILFLFLFSALFNPAYSYRRYLNNAPNSGLVPCPPGGAPGCHGTNFCEAWGHEACEALSGATAAGLELQTSLETTQPLTGWSVSLCASDSDGDGLTNGDELGDGCCAWPLFPVMTSSDISNPSSSLSKSKRPSCSSMAPPSAPANVTAASAGLGAVRISWIPSDISTVCVCEVVIKYAAGGGVSQFISVNAISASTGQIVLCGLPPGSNFIVQSVTFHNRAGAGASNSLGATAQSGSSGSSPSANVCTPLNVAGFYMNSANSAPASAIPQPPMIGPAGGAAIFLVIGLIFALVGAVITSRSDPASSIRHFFVHRYMQVEKKIPPTTTSSSSSRVSRNDGVVVSPPQAPPASGIGRASNTNSTAAAAAAVPSNLKVISALLSTWFNAVFNLDDLREGSVGYPLAILAAIIASALCTLWSAIYWSYLPYPLGTRGAGGVGRALGQALIAIMGLQLLPAARYSIFLRVFGVSFERSLKFHRWCGILVLILTGLHAVLLLRVYAFDAANALGSAAAAGELNWTFLFSWLPSDAVNPLAGTLSGLCMLILTVLAIDPIRRRYYEVFLLGHALWPPAFVLAFLHIKDSDAIVIPLFAAPLALCAIDFAALFCDFFWLRPTVLIDAGVICADGSVISCSSASSSSSSTSVVDSTSITSGSITSTNTTTTTSTTDAVAAFLVMDKLNGAIGGLLWPFSHLPGQFVYVQLPGRAGLFPHPVSVSSVSDSAFPGRFTVHIRSMGKGTWSGAVVAAIAEAVDVSKKHTSLSTMPSSDSVDHSLNIYSNTVASTLPWAIPNGGMLQPPSAEIATIAQLETRPIPATLRNVLRVSVSGPFGEPSVHLPHYRHFVLIAGGIGITPIASLHLALVRGQPVGEVGGPSLLGLWSVAKAVCCGGGRIEGVGAVREGGGEGGGGGQTFIGGHRDGSCAELCSLTTVWSVRDAGLVTAFAPMLEGEASRMGRNGGGEGGERVVSVDDQEVGTIKKPIIDLRVHLTKPSGANGGASSSLSQPLPFETRNGRPDIEALFRASGVRAAEDMGTGAAVAIVVCGPGPLVSDVLNVAARLTRTFEHHLPDSNGGTMNEGAANQGTNQRRAAAVVSSTRQPPIRVRFDVHRETFVL